MRPPEIEGAMFIAACGLYHGPATLDELHELTEWETTRDNLIKTLSELRGRALAERGDIERRADSGEAETVFGYRLTDDGRRAVMETIDNYLFIVKRFTDPNEAAKIARPEVLSFTIRDDGPERPHRDRHPFPSELDILLGEAPPEAGPPIRVILGARLHARDVCGLLVEDFDRAAGALAIAGRVVRLAPELQRVIIEAIGERGAGPLFVRPTGRAWNSEALSNAFREARDAAGLERDLVLIGRHHNHKGRQHQHQRKQSSHAKPETSRLMRS